MTATLEQARTAIRATDRQSQILDAVDHMLRVHDLWESDPKAPDVPSQALEEAILGAIDTCEHGDIPAQCRELCTVAMARLRLEWDMYANEDARRSDGSPTARFWAAFKAVVTARQGAVPFVPKRVEPVKELIRQQVSYDQIARHIYGYRGKGPFIREDGSIDIDAILREAEKPGSVVPPDWLHPLELQRKQEYEQTAVYRLSAATARENGDTAEEGRTSVDRATIEDFLLQGAMPHVIANVKGVPLSEVLAVQNRLYAEGKLKLEGSAPVAETAPAPAPEAKPAETPAAAPAPTPPNFDAKTFIAEHAATCGVPEIVAGLKENGVKMTQKQVQAMISELNKAAT